MKPTLSLVETAYKLNSELENNYLALAVCLSELKENEAWDKEEFTDFTDFYKRGLGREKSTISNLLKAGDWLRANYEGRLPAGNPSYKRLAASIRRNPEAEPALVLAEAATWTDSDYKDFAREECNHNKPHVLVCSGCWKRMDK